MALSAFDDKHHPPGPEDLEVVLGKAGAHWDDLLHHLHEKYPPAGNGPAVDAQYQLLHPRIECLDTGRRDIGF